MRCYYTLYSVTHSILMLKLFICNRSDFFHCLHSAFLDLKNENRLVSFTSVYSLSVSPFQILIGKHSASVFLLQI